LKKGIKCGSNYIDLEFRRWLKEMIGEQNYMEIDPNTHLNTMYLHGMEGKAMRDLMKQFTRYKRKFNRKSKDMRLNLPTALSSLTTLGVLNGEITITPYVPISVSGAITYVL
jgi:hypothetical protein